MVAKILSIISILLSLLVIAVSISHRMSFDDQQVYTSSPLIIVEAIILLTMLLMLLPQIVALIFLGLKKDWLWFAISVFAFLSLLSGFMGAAAIDAPTILYGS